MQLVALVEQFFDPKLPYEQKRQLDAQLSTFRQQPDAWRHCQPMINDASQELSEHVLWFALSVYEEMIKRRWQLQSEADKEEVKRSLLELLRARHDRVKPYVLNKLVQVIADVARRSWPQGFPELFPMIQAMLFERPLRALGLTLLRAVAEEFVSTRSDINAARKSELRAVFAQHVPGVISMLRQILDEAVVLATVGHGNFGSYSARAEDTSVPRDALFDLASSPNSRPLFSPQSYTYGADAASALSSPRGMLDVETINTCQLCLEILLGLFSWIPLNETIDAALISTILQFAQLNDAASISLGRHAMACVNELVTRNCAPPQFQSFLGLIFKHLFEILRELVSDGQGTDIDDLDEEYRLKFTEFLKVFIQQHFHRFESDASFPVFAFLELLFRFTHRQPSMEGLQECLGIWNRLLEYLVTCKEKGALSISEKYKTGLLSFAEELSKKVSFIENSSALNELDDESEDDNGQTEFDIFFGEYLELSHKLAVLYPTEHVGSLYAKLDAQLKIAEQAISRPRSDQRIQESLEIGLTYKDLTLSLRIFGRIAELFVASFHDTFQPTHQLMQRFLVLVSACLKQFSIHHDSEDYVKLTREAYAVLLSFAPWLVVFQQNARPDVEGMSKFDALCSAIVSNCVVSLRAEYPESISLVASTVLKSVFVTIRPDHLFQYGSVTEFLGNVHNMSVPLQRKVKANLYYATSTACLSLLPNAGALSHADTAMQQYQQFVCGITQPFAHLQQQPLFFQQLCRNADVQPQVVHVLVVLTSLVESAANERLAVKQVLYDAIKETLPVVLELFKAYRADSEMQRTIMDFFNVLFGSLRKQLGVDGARHVISAFVELFDARQIELWVAQDNVKSVEVLCRFFDLLKTVVEDNSKQFDALTVDIVQFCIGRAPLIMQHVKTDVGETMQLALFPLIHSTILHNWNYFFPASTAISQIARMRQQLDRNATIGDENKTGHEEEFVALLGCVATSFRQWTLTLFRHNLAMLEDLHSKSQLFQQPVFREKMAATFLQLLLTVLVEKRVDLLRDEIVQTIFQMATVDLAWFHSSFLPGFLLSVQGVPDMNKTEIMNGVRVLEDAPSFADQIGRLVDDIAFFSSRNTAAVLA